MKVTSSVVRQILERGRREALKRLAVPARIILRTVLVCLIAPGAVVLAQDPPAAAAVRPAEGPLTAHSKSLYNGSQKILLRTAENMPEENYSFKPAEVVRSFGQIVGHVADSQYTFCSMVLGEKNPRPRIEQTKTSKSDLVAALKDAFAYCDKAYAGIGGDSAAAQMVNVMGGDKPKLGVLNINTVHTIEHYGNLVTYMRMKGLVPPTSEPAFMKSLAQ